MRPTWYNLRHEPIDAAAAGTLLRDGEARHVGLDRVGNLEISTVFVVLDQGRAGPPTLYQTKVFPYANHENCLVNFTMNYASREEALAGHERIIQGLRRALRPTG